MRRDQFIIAGLTIIMVMIYFQKCHLVANPDVRVQKLSSAPNQRHVCKKEDPDATNVCAILLRICSGGMCSSCIQCGGINPSNLCAAHRPFNLKMCGVVWIFSQYYKEIIREKLIVMSNEILGAPLWKHY